jgi:hypothetical protein
MEVVMRELENVRNEIPTYVMDRLENEWRLVQAQSARVKTGLSTQAPVKAAPGAPGGMASFDK